MDVRRRPWQSSLMRVLGFMSGTSLDAVDMAVLETDGETIFAFGPAGEQGIKRRVGVDHGGAFAGREARLQDGDEVALMPPVSGG